MPYSAALISLSVPSTPTRSTFTSTPRPPGTSSSVGSSSSARCAEPGFPGWTAIAFMVFFSGRLVSRLPARPGEFPGRMAGLRPAGRRVTGGLRHPPGVAPFPCQGLGVGVRGREQGRKLHQVLREHDIERPAEHYPQLLLEPRELGEVDRTP